MLLQPTISRRNQCAPRNFQRSKQKTLLIYSNCNGRTYTSQETQEVCEAVDLQELTAELADVLEAINGLCKAYNISQEHLKAIQEQKYQERGGFEQGFFVEALEMAEGNPRAAHFRKSPDKYPEFSTKK